MRGVAHRRRPLRTTLVVLLVGTIIVLCLLVGVVTHVSVSAQLHHQLDGQLARAAERRLPPDADPSSGKPPSEQGPGGGEFELGALVDGSRGTAEGSWRASDGTVHSLSDADRRRLVAAISPARSGQDLDVRLSIGSYRIHVSPVSGSAAGNMSVTGLPLAPTRSTLTRLDLTLLAAGLTAALVSGVIGALIVRRTLHPLEEVATVAGRVAELPMAHGDVALRDRVPPEVARSGTEAGDVGLALNHLLDNVDEALSVRQRSEEAMRRFIADASHELRTPLTAIRGYSELLRITERLSDRGAASLDRMDLQTTRMTALVGDLLLLARLDEAALAPGSSAEGSSGGTVDLGEIVLDAVMDARVTAPSHVWRLDMSEDEFGVHGDAGQLRRTAVNLISNAHKHTPDGTTVTVRLHAETGGYSPGRVAILEVIDDGPGIDLELSGDVFARFIRADTARSGNTGTAGLGLSIARAVAEAHHGSVTVETRPGRTVFTLRLPLRA